MNQLIWKQWKLNRQSLVLLGMAIGLIALSWIGIAAARSGLTVRSLEQGRVPLLYLVPEAAKSVPGVLVAHGFAGSKQLMLGYGHALAQAGYAVILWDSDGHGANPSPLKQYDSQASLEIARQALLQQPEVDSTRLALLGHSMGSGFVMETGIRHPERFAATIAISPTGASVTPQLPRNLQLQAGSGEGGFVDNARRLLEQAGGTTADLAQGKGRELVVVPNVEHITILFSDVSHQAAVRWLDGTFGRSSQSRYVDRRMGWYGLHLLGWLLGLAAVAPVLATPMEITKGASWRRWIGLVVAPIAAVAGVTLLSQRVLLENLGGVQVGGAVGVWFLLAGLAWLSVLAAVPRPTLRSLSLGIGLFGLLWIAFGAMAQVVWLQWWLTPMRLQLWLPLAIACFPWFLAAGIVQQNIGTGKRTLWWLAQSGVLILGFGVTLYFVPSLGFMFLLLPLFPPLIGILALVAGWVNSAWVYAIGSALFFGWLLAAGFPLSV